MALISLALVACGNDRALPEPTKDTPLPSRVRLLTDVQYVNAVHDLLGPVTVPPIVTPGASAYDFLREEIISVDAGQLVQYRIAAESVARQVATRTGDPLGFATRAFRRPLEADERAQLTAMVQQGGFGLVVEAVLQAPQFIYRTELGPGALDSYQLASELSFLLLDSIPDDGLWAAANDGSLLRDDVLTAQVDRLLADPRVQANLDEAVIDWLDVRRVLTAGKDLTVYPEYSTALQQSMFDESVAFVHDVMWNRKGRLDELLTSTRMFADGRTAPIYGVAIATDSPTLVALDQRERAGILTHASVLSFLGTTRRESIIARGIYVDRKFLCMPEPGRPPFNAITGVAHITGGLSEAQFAHYRLHDSLCKQCHTDIDPPGWALESYDGIGRFRSMDENDQAVQDEAVLTLDGKPTPIRGARELATALASSPQVARCVVDQFVHHAYGRAFDTDLANSSQALYDRFDDSDHDLVDLFRGIVTAPAFRQRGGAR